MKNCTRKKFSFKAQIGKELIKYTYNTRRDSRSCFNALYIEK